MEEAFLDVDYDAVEALWELPRAHTFSYYWGKWAVSEAAQAAYGLQPLSVPVELPSPPRHRRGHLPRFNLLVVAPDEAESQDVHVYNNLVNSRRKGDINIVLYSQLGDPRVKEIGRSTLSNAVQEHPWGAAQADPVEGFLNNYLLHGLLSLAAKQSAQRHFERIYNTTIIRREVQRKIFEAAGIAFIPATLTVNEFFPLAIIGGTFLPVLIYASWMKRNPTSFHSHNPREGAARFSALKYSTKILEDLHGAYCLYPIDECFSIKNLVPRFMTENK